MEDLCSLFHHLKVDTALHDTELLPDESWHGEQPSM